MNSPKLTRSRRREQGSTILYAIVLSGVGAAFALANMQLAMTGRTLQERREDEVRWKYVKNAAAALLDAKIRSTPATTPETFTLSIGGEVYTVDVARTSAPKEFKLTISNDYFGIQEAKALDPRGKHPFLYGLFIDGNINSNDDLTLGSASAPAHAYFDGAVNLANGQPHRCYGALETRNNTAPNFDTLELITTGVDRAESAATSSLNYVLGANELVIGDRTVGTGTYGSGTSQYLVNASGNVTVKGTIRGRVTVFANKINIDPPLRVADANSKIVLIARNDVVVDSSGIIEAFVYTDKKLEVKNGSVNWTGAIVCQDLDQTSPLTITLDPLFYDRDELTNFRVPQNGYGLD